MVETLGIVRWVMGLEGVINGNVLVFGGIDVYLQIFGPTGASV